MWQSLGILKVFNTLTLKQLFRKTKTFLKKLEYWFLIQSTKNEIVIFLHKTALSKAKVKTNRRGNTKWAYHKEWTFATDYFWIWIWKLNLSLRASYKQSMYKLPRSKFLHFSWTLQSFICGYIFPVSILNITS